MHGPQDPPSFMFVAAAILGAIGVGLMIPGVLTDTGWELLVGLVALLVGLLGMWRIQAVRDQTLR